MFRKLATAATIAVLTLLTRAPLAYAQKALVYCPIGVDATGCDRIVGALASKFPEGVDRGYDGSAGTVDLSKVDLHHYAVFVVPSLADDTDKQPYALLRKVASRLHYAINGRVAVYSGAPDQGNSNREDKDALIQNLASWASDGHTRKTGLVGMVAFLDLSENEGARYSWVRDVSLVDVSADTEDQSIGAATTVGTRGGDLLKVNGRQLAFSNMASNGLHIGNRGAARTEIGAIGGTTAHQSVLVTYSNADGAGDGSKTTKLSSSGASYNLSAGKASLDVTGSGTSGATLTTDKPDYLPGDTVTFTGTGFAAGDTVTITVHEDPTWSYPDRSFKSVADANGAFVDRQMVVDQQDFGATFTATALGNPSGTVAQATFTDGNSAVTGTVTSSSGGTPISGATVTCTTGCSAGTNPVTTALNGTYTLSVNFSGNNASINISVSATGFVTGIATGVSVANNSPNPVVNFSLTPTTATTTTSLVTSGSPSVFGQSVTLTATVAPSPGAGNGTVDFKDGPSTTICSAAAINAAGVATCVTSTLAVGGHSITAAYGGTTGFTGSTSTGVTQTVNKANTTTTVVTSLTPSVFGQQVSFTATVAPVAPGAGSPSGSVTFKDGATPICSAVALASGQATCQTSALTVASHTINADYSGDGNFNISSGNVTQTVNKASSTTTVVTSLTPSVFGQQVTFTATVAPVAPGAGSPSGSVTFKEGATNICSSVALASGQATCQTTTLAVGAHTITADYNGDANFDVSTGNVSQVVNKAATSTSVVSSLNPSTFGQSVKFTATVAVTSPGAGTPTGTVTFKNGATAICSNVALTGNSAECTTSALVPSTPPGHPITASYSGDGSFDVSTSSTLNQVVNKADQTITFAALADKTFGDGDFAVSATASSGLPVTFSVGATDQCTISGTTVHITAAGSCTVTAKQAGDGNYNAAPDVPRTFAIGKANASITVTPYSGVYDGNQHGVTGSATGVGGVDLSAGLSLGAKFTDVPGGTAHWTFTGGTNYNDASGDAAVTISKAASTTTVDPLTVPYDGSAHQTTAHVSGVGTGITQTVTWSYSGNCSAAPVNVVETPCTAKATYAGDSNHDGSFGSNTITITAKLLTASIIGDPCKTYDGNTNATLTSANFSLSGFVSPQSATVTKTSGTFNSPNVSGANSVNVTLAPSDFTAGSGTLLSNYTLPTTASGAGHIHPATLTYTATPASRAFGAANPPFSGLVAGFVNSETQLGVTTGALAFTTTATTTSDVGSYPINGSGLTANYGNYTFVQAAGNATALTITQATPTITITWNNSTYNNTANAATAVVTGVLTPTDVLSNSPSLTYYAGSTASGSALSGAPVDAGTYTVRASYPGSTNYIAKYQDKTITIDKANASITVTPYSGVYDGNAHGVTGSATGVGGVDLTAGLSLGAKFTDVPGGNAHWTFAGGTNYNDASGDAAVAISKASSTTTVDPLTVPYDGAPHQTTAHVSGVGTGITQAVTWTYSGNCLAAPTNVIETPCTAKATYGGDGNHDGSYGSNTITITAKLLSASIVGNPFKTYDGNANATLTSANYSLGGFVSPQSATVTKTSGTFNSPNVSDANSVSVTLASSDFTAGASTLLSNYTLPTTASGPAHLDPATLTYVANTATRTFGASDPPFSGSVTGFVNSETQSGATSGALAFTTTATTTSPVGSYPINGSGLTANYGNYAFVQAAANATAFSITQATPTITITWNNSTYNNTANAATAVVTGVLTPTDVLSNSPTLTYYTGSTASGSPLSGAPVDAGTYTVRASYPGNTNYKAKDQDKTITIDKASSTTTVNVLSVPYDASPHTTTALVSGVGTGITQDVTWSYSGSCSAPPVKVLDTPCTAKATYAGDGNHYGSYGSNTITITRISASVTAKDAAKAYGDVLSFAGTEFTTSGLIGGDAVTSVTLTSAGAPAAAAPTTYPITPSAAVGTGLTNYDISYNAGTLTVSNDTPVITSLTGPTAPVALNSPVTVTGAFNDHGVTGDPYVVSSTWIDAGSPLAVPNVGAASYDGNTGTFSITAPANIPVGVYTVTVTVTDRWQAASAPKTVSGYVVVYDPSGGFVTGGGWINSPANACQMAVTCLDANGNSLGVTGKANFGFTSKYQKGANVPTGSTEFQFQAGNLNFKSIDFQWLVIQSTTKAQFKGTGTINGQGKYNFLVTAIDGDNFGGANKKADAFRIKITDIATGAVLYDNQMGTDETGDSATFLGGGSIVIHDK